MGGPVLVSVREFGVLRGAEGDVRRQTADGKRQKAEGRRQAADGKRGPHPRPLSHPSTARRESAAPLRAGRERGGRHSLTG
ncbi:MAG: hypothetical protein EXS64_01340 [Candidatus Latescibacteria bacterium]|nr:hypothetical protein [Candidatus Latescibacterota bacterium]